jgi:hypothetical protein
MSRIPASPPAVQTQRAHSAPAAERSPSTGPGRLNIAYFENRLYGTSCTVPREQTARPTREIGQTLSAFKVAPSPALPSPPQRPETETGKHVRFAEHRAEKAIDGSPIASAARHALSSNDLNSLSDARCLVEEGDPMPARYISTQLLNCLSLNDDKALVSRRSEKLLAKAFLEAKALPRKMECGAGDHPYDVLDVFLTLVGKKDPTLLS